MRPFVDDVSYQRRFEVLERIIADFFAYESHTALVKASRRFCQRKPVGYCFENPSKQKKKLEHFLAERRHILNELKVIKPGDAKVEIWETRR
jgi:hypothetical protein